jgi:hypothetical protein
MAQNTNPIFILTPNLGQCTLSAANTNRDGSGSLTTLFTAGSNGSRVDVITFQNAGTQSASSAMIGRIFCTDTSGINPRLIAEVSMPTATPSNTAVGQVQNVTFTNGLVMGSGQIIKVTQSVNSGAQDTLHVLAKGGDY